MSTPENPVQPQAPEIDLPPIVVDLTSLTEEARIVQLYRDYPAAKAKADAAAADLKTITDGIKLELSNAAPAARKIELRGPDGIPLRYAKQVTRRFDTKRFQAERPDVYEAYRKPSESWVLTQIKDGE